MLDSVEEDDSFLKEIASAAPKKQSEVKEFEPIKLIPCGKCPRKFGEKVVEKHRKICGKVGKPKKVFKASKHRVTGTFFAKYYNPRKEQRCKHCNRSFLQEQLKNHSSICVKNPMRKSITAKAGEVESEVTTLTNEETPIKTNYTRKQQPGKSLKKPKKKNVQRRPREEHQERDYYEDPPRYVEPARQRRPPQDYYGRREVHRYDDYYEPEYHRQHSNYPPMHRERSKCIACGVSPLFGKFCSHCGANQEAKRDVKDSPKKPIPENAQKQIEETDPEDEELNKLKNELDRITKSNETVKTPLEAKESNAEPEAPKRREPEQEPPSRREYEQEPPPRRREPEQEPPRREYDQEHPRRRDYELEHPQRRGYDYQDDRRHYNKPQQRRPRYDEYDNPRSQQYPQRLRSAPKRSSASVTSSPPLDYLPPHLAFQKNLAELVPCMHCHRRFHVKSLPGHEKICQKVFGNDYRRKSRIPKAKDEYNEIDSRNNGIDRYMLARANSASASKRSHRYDQYDYPDQRQQQPARRRPQRSKSIRSGSMNTEGTERRARFANLANLMREQVFQPCPHCTRKFAPYRIDDHISICKSVRNRPRPLRRGQKLGYMRTTSSAYNPRARNH